LKKGNNQRWILSCFILAILIVSGIFRWSHEADKSITEGVAAWKKDRWTGQVWLVGYAANDVRERPIGPEFEYNQNPPQITGFDKRLFEVEAGTTDPFGRIGLYKLLPPTEEQMQEYIKQRGLLDISPQELDGVDRLVLEHLVKVDEWEQSVEQAERNIEAVWTKRSVLTKAWLAIMALNGIWLLRELFLNSYRSA